MMNCKLSQLKKFNWKLFFALCLLALVPALYQTIKTFIISVNNGTQIFDIIGQMGWFDLINETLQAFLIVPLYSILNKILKNNKDNFSKFCFKIGIIVFLLYALFSIGVFFYGKVLIQKMNPNETNISEVNAYLSLETIAFMIGIIISFVNVVYVVVGNVNNVYIFLVIKTVLSVMADFIFIPLFGVFGVALSNIIVNFILALGSLVLLCFQNYLRFAWFEKADLSIFKQWWKTGIFSGSQQFIDNIVYAIMICKMVNLVSEQGNYWLANNFIWGWLLIPITALTEIIRRDCKDGYENLKQFNYYYIGGFVIILWLITIPLWLLFFKNVEHLTNANEVFFITLKLVPFYIAYIGCAIIDNIFNGLGKTVYNAINSLIINFVYYGIFYILYLKKSFLSKWIQLFLCLVLVW